MDTLPDLSSFGVAGLMFLAYYILHQSTFTLLKNMVDQLKTSNEDALNNIVQSFERISQRQKETEDRNYNSLKELTETMQMTVAAIGKLESRIGTLEVSINNMSGKRGKS